MGALPGTKLRLALYSRHVCNTHWYILHCMSPSRYCIQCSINIPQTHSLWLPVLSLASFSFCNGPSSLAMSPLDFVLVRLQDDVSLVTFLPNEMPCGGIVVSVY